eukprot:CAMPEP_0172808696 /NCGR_PEP_ID=MMETSP1075-20121228/7842_1 /TAXON_ID=2916 /ORGANISM="Ceratium fusus, Strain PA161109" /LENGTH=565 /DNA_ID=CAMNT_0013647879 /DNA_START=251 /DNA_END=1948 /DNA_ORIENTATION=-
MLLQVSMELTRNASHSSRRSPPASAGHVSNQTLADARASTTARAGVAVPTSAFSTGSTLLNATLSSADLVALLRAVELSSLRRTAKVGRTGFFPHLHVARRHVFNESRPLSAIDRRVALALTQALPVGAVRLAITLGGVFTVLVSGFMTASKKGLITTGQSRLINSHVELGSADDENYSTWDVKVSIFSSLVSTGCLALPYACKLSGYFALLISATFALCTVYTAHLMSWALSDLAQEADRRGIKPRLRGWGFLAEAAFGQRCRSAVETFLVFELWGYLVSGMVCATINLNQLYEDIGTPTALGLTVVIVFALTTYAPVQSLTRMNLVSNGIFSICLLMFIVTGILLPARAPASDLEFVKPSGLIASASILVYSNAGHGIYPELMQRMEEPEKFPACVRQASFLAFLVYVAVAAPGYYYFGNAVQPSAVQNIGVDLHFNPIPNLGWMSSVAAFGMTVKMMSNQAMTLTPLASVVEGSLGEAVPRAVVVPFLLTVSAMVASRFASSLASLLSFIGSVFCMNIVFVMPVACYWKLAPESVCGIQRIFFATLLSMGFSFALLGVVASL